MAKDGYRTDMPNIFFSFSSCKLDLKFEMEVGLLMVNKILRSFLLKNKSSFQGTEAIFVV